MENQELENRIKWEYEHGKSIGLIASKHQLSSNAIRRILSNHFIETHIGGAGLCIICNRQVNGIRDHFKEHHPEYKATNKNQQLYCNVCGCCCHSYPALVKHYDFRHFGKKPKRVVLKIRQQRGIRNTCSICKEQYKLFPDHIRERHPEFKISYKYDKELRTGRYICDLCNRETKPGRFTRHYFIYHSEITKGAIKPYLQPGETTPIPSSTDSITEILVNLTTALKNSRQRVLELESEKVTLEEKLSKTNGHSEKLASLVVEAQELLTHRD